MNTHDNTGSPGTARSLSAALSEQAQRDRDRPLILLEGEAALRRLFAVAQGQSGQCRVIAAFLLGCYNGQRFPFDLSDFRVIDTDLFDDCMAVLAMDANPQREVHTYFENGGEAFEQLARDWNITDVMQLKEALKAARP